MCQAVRQALLERADACPVEGRACVIGLVHVAEARHVPRRRFKVVVRRDEVAGVKRRRPTRGCEVSRWALGWLLRSCHLPAFGAIGLPVKLPKQHDSRRDLQGARGTVDGTSVEGRLVARAVGCTRCVTWAASAE